MISKGLPWRQMIAPLAEVTETYYDKSSSEWAIFVSILMWTHLIDLVLNMFIAVREIIYSLLIATLDQFITKCSFSMESCQQPGKADYRTYHLKELFKDDWNPQQKNCLLCFPLSLPKWQTMDCHGRAQVCAGERVCWTPRKVSDQHVSSFLLWLMNSKHRLQQPFSATENFFVHRLYHWLRPRRWIFPLVDGFSPRV